MLKRLLFVVLLACASVAQAAVFSLPWGPKPQFVDANGAPMSGGTISTFLATSSTPQVTYTDSTGGTANPTTITLNVRGETPNEVWLTGGVSYKLILKDSAGATVWTVDGISGVNDTTSAFSEWLSGPTPTFVSGTSFTLAGDQTVEFHKGRRLKTTNSGGTIYSTIVSSVFGASTTVTVANDSSVLDSGLSAVSYGIIRAANTSVSPDMIYRKGTAVASAATTDIWSIAGDYVHVTGVVTITSLGTAAYAGDERTVIFDSALTLTHNATTLVLPGSMSIVTAANDRMTVRADTTSNLVVTSYVRASVDPVLVQIAKSGRLTLTTATPVTTSDVTAATTVFFSPYNGNFTEVSQATTDATKSPAAVTTNSNYDVFLWVDSGTLRATRGPLWTSDTARGAGAGTTELQLTNGAWTNKNAITNGPGAGAGIYLGTIRSDGSSQINDSKATRGVWNNFNRVERFLAAGFSASRTTSSATWTELNTEIRNNFVLGLAEDAISSTFNGVASNDTLGSVSFSSISIDSTTVPLDTMTGSQFYTGTAAASLSITVLNNPSIGFHFMTAVGSVNANTGTWSGAAFPGTSTRASRCVLTTRIRG